VRLRTLAVSRAVNVAPGVGLVVLAWAMVLDGDLGVWRWPAAVLSISAGLYMAVRGPRAEVVCDERGVVVRGLLWTRAVPRRAVVEVTDFPALRWRDDRGRARWTPLTMFVSYPTLLPVHVRHSEEQVRRLRRWVHRRR